MRRKDGGIDRRYGPRKFAARNVPRQPARTTNPTTRAVFDIADEQGVKLRNLAERAGIAYSQMMEYRAGRHWPRIDLVEALAGALDHELVLRRKK